jgi:hypothetical protein
MYDMPISFRYENRTIFRHLCGTSLIIETKMSNIYFSEKNHSDFCRNLGFKMDSSGKHQLPPRQVSGQHNPGRSPVSRQYKAYRKE